VAYNEIFEQIKFIPFAQKIPAILSTFVEVISIKNWYKENAIYCPLQALNSHLRDFLRKSILWYGKINIVSLKRYYAIIG